MATVSPPSPSAPPPPAREEPPSPPPRAPRALPPNAGSLLAFGALAVVAVLVLYLALSGGRGADYHLEMKEAGQLVRGDQVQVGGVPVGSVTNIELTPDYKARVTIHVGASLTPLHEGTVSEVRVPSLTGVANRYIALTPGPNNAPALAAGATLPAGATREVVDLDTLFNTLNPKTREGLKNFVRGSAEQYAGAGPQLGETTEYFAPSFAALDHIFAELTRDQATFTSFLVETAKAVTTLAARRESLSGLVEHGDQAFQAIGSQQSALAQALRRLPGTLARGNHTFVELPSTLASLTRFVRAQGSNIPALQTLLTRLQPLLTTATPVVTNFSQAISRPGPSNDLTDAFNAVPELARVLATSSPNAVRALREALPTSAPLGPYAPELVGAAGSFGQTTAYYDANGHYARISPVTPSFKLEPAKNNLTPTSAQQGLEGLTTGQLRRCPGAATQPSADGSAPFTNNGQLGCDPTQTP